MESAPAITRATLGSDGYTLPRLLIGGWQLSRGHREGALDEDELFAGFERMVEAGLTAFDCADIYTGVEELLGRFHRRARTRSDRRELQFHTKYVPDQDALERIDKHDVARVIERSLSRLQVERLDLVQFAWWDYSVPRYVEVAGWLCELQRAGKIRHLGTTNFDVARIQEMLAAGIPIVANQVQYSLLDRRPENGLVALSDERGMGILCYGALAGGFLSERYLAQPEPAAPLGTRSLTKYRLILEEAGGWNAYQRLLAALKNIADKHAVAIANVAVRYVLERPAVTAAIIGTYNADHLATNLESFGWSLDAEDMRAIEAAQRACPSPRGDVFGLEREPASRHSQIMWKNIEREA